MRYASYHYGDADGWDSDAYSEPDYDEGDMPSISDGYGDSGEGGWDYDDT